jgi:hypothetical protein
VAAASSRAASSGGSWARARARRHRDGGDERRASSVSSPSRPGRWGPPGSRARRTAARGAPPAARGSASGTGVSRSPPARIAARRSSPPAASRNRGLDDGVDEPCRATSGGRLSAAVSGSQNARLGRALPPREPLEPLSRRQRRGARRALWRAAIARRGGAPYPRSARARPARPSQGRRRAVRPPPGSRSSSSPLPSGTKRSVPRRFRARTCHRQPSQTCCRSRPGRPSWGPPDVARRPRRASSRSPHSGVRQRSAHATPA